jgi:hypothetical protein
MPIRRSLMDVGLLLSSSVVGALVGALLKGLWDRRAAKKEPKTEMRAEAYRDFVIYVVSTARTSSVPPMEGSAVAKPDEIKARLLLSGESDVVAAVSHFLSRHATLDSENAIADFTTVVCEMRKSLLTGHGPTVAVNIRALLSAQASGHNKWLNTDERQASLPRVG